MKKTQNEAKAKEIAALWNKGTEDVPSQDSCIAFDSAIRAMGWKDEQFAIEKQEWLKEVYDGLKPLLDPDSLMVVQHKLLELVYPVEYL